MTVLDFFAIATNIFTALVCGAISILLFSQLRSDRKSQFLLRLMLSITASRFAVILMRYVGASGNNAHDLFVVAAILTISSPYFLYVFVNEYFESWTVMRRRIACGMQILLLIFVTVLLAELLLHRSLILELNIFIAADGSVQYQYGPFVAFNVLLSVYDELAIGMMLYMVYQEFRKDGLRFNRQVGYGIGILGVGMMLIPIPGIDHLALEQNFYALGSLVLIGPVIGQRLFDPLSQLNRRLERRAQQMTLITNVGTQAHALLSLTELLPGVANEICQSFGYARVQIAVYDTKSALIAYGSGDAEGHILNSASADVEITQPHSTSRLASIAIDLPIPIGKALSDDILTGTMTISVKQGEAITSDERGVLNILARQIALAIHNAQLFEQVQRANTAKTMFISFVSHELRNEVSNVISLTDGLLNAPEEYDNQRLQPVHEPDVRKINQTGLQLKRLLDDVVDWGQIESGQVTLVMQRVDPLPILQEVAAQARDRVRKGVVVKTIYPSTLPAVQADPTRLQQILLNLIGNAIKFTAQGSITLDTRVEDSFMQFSVADTGRGIAKTAQATLFELYSQGSPEIRRRFGGSGLGLTISKQFVERQGGHIWIESEAGKGTTFFFTVPLADVPSEAHETQ